MTAKGASGSEIDEFEAEWVKKHKLMTFDEAVIAHLQSENAPQSSIDSYRDAARLDPNMAIASRRALAAEFTKHPVFFSWDIPRTREGFYHFRAGFPAAIK